jgi:hypothetical protein
MFSLWKFCFAPALMTGWQVRTRARIQQDINTARRQIFLRFEGRGKAVPGNKNAINNNVL